MPVHTAPGATALTQTSTARFAAIGLGLLPTPLTCDVGFVVNGMPVKGFESPERQTFTEG